ncbi:hypothetical protein, partial [Enterobacter hormaechei]|uniref:hypothetical protein n=1 Tax=Enterobacter hormaechei TaxID=158836 RepID=UPI0022F04D00
GVPGRRLHAGTRRSVNRILYGIVHAQSGRLSLPGISRHYCLPPVQFCITPAAVSFMVASGILLPAV